MRTCFFCTFSAKRCWRTCDPPQLHTQATNRLRPSRSSPHAPGKRGWPSILWRANRVLKTCEKSWPSISKCEKIQIHIFSWYTGDFRYMRRRALAEGCGRAVTNGDAIRRGKAGRMKRNDLEANSYKKCWCVLRFILLGRLSQSCHDLRARSRGALHRMLVRVPHACCAALNMF